MCGADGGPTSVPALSAVGPGFSESYSMSIESRDPAGAAVCEPNNLLHWKAILILDLMKALLWRSFVQNRRGPKMIRNRDFM